MARRREPARRRWRRIGRALAPPLAATCANRGLAKRQSPLGGNIGKARLCLGQRGTGCGCVCGKVHMERRAITANGDVNFAQRIGHQPNTGAGCINGIAQRLDPVGKPLRQIMSAQVKRRGGLLGKRKDGRGRCGKRRDNG